MLSSLPGRPLTLSEVHALSHSDAVETSRPLVAFDAVAPAEEIIACALTTESGRQLLGYHAAAETWRIITTMSLDASPEELDRISDTVIDWVTSTYDPNDVIIIDTTGSSDPVEAILPAHPLGRDDLPTLESLPGVDAVHPMFCLEDTHEIIALLTFQATPDAPDEFILANYGYDPDGSTWQQIERARAGATEAPPDPDGLTIHDWIPDHYDMNTVLAISPDPL